MVIASGLAALSCKSSSPEPEVRIRFWHAFNAEEAEAVNRTLGRWQPGERISVELVRETFARGQNMLRQTLSRGQNCPDLARIDATWLPGLVTDELLTAAPKQLVSGRPWLPAALQLAGFSSVTYGVPQSIDGLALIYNTARVTKIEGWPPRSIDQLLAMATTAARDGGYGLGLRVDGYWFVPFLRQWGGALVDVESGRLGIDTPRAAAALAKFAGLFGTVSPPPAASGKAAEIEAQQFRAGSLPIVVDGPWAVAELTGGDTRRVAVAALPGAPLGGQILVVPICAPSAEWAWKLADYLTSPSVQAEWAQRPGMIPTTRDGIARSDGFVKQFHGALREARPLPRHPVTSQLFDDFSPAVAAVVAGDATAEEALAGVARSWSRLLDSYGITPRPYLSPSVQTLRQNGLKR